MTKYKTKEEIEKELLEIMADIEHTRWSKWQNYLHQKLDYSTGKYVLPEALFERWNRQIHTLYSELSESEKESDREQVRPYLEIIHQLRQQDIEAIVEIIEEMKFKETFTIIGESYNGTLDKIIDKLKALNV